MTRKLCILGTLILAMVGITSVADAATWAPLNGVQAQETAPQVQLLRSDYQSVQLMVNVAGFTWENAQTKSGTFTTLSMAEEGYTTQIGSPQLPVIRKMIEIPFGAQVSLVIGPTVMRQATLSDFGIVDRIIPVQPPIEKLPGALEAATFELDQSAYDRSGFQIGQFARIVEEGQMRDHRFILLEIYPLDYSPTEGLLRIVSSVEITIQLTGSDLSLTRQIKTRYSDRQFEALARRTFLNPGFMAEDLVSVPLGMLIITNNHYASLPVMTDFINWKKNQGYHVTVAVVEQIGTTNTAIKAYIQNAYNTWTIPPDFVVLVGDVNVIPHWVGTGADSPCTDLYYATLAGGDIFADVSIGRLSPSTDANLGIMINKTLQYEQVGWIGGDNWIKRAVFMASNDNYTVSEGTHNFVINNYLDPAGYTSTKLYCHTYGATTQQTTDNINAGRSLAIYSGHGDVTLWADGPAFNQSNVNALVNTYYPFVCSHACLTGQFTASECFGETWLRTSHGTFAFWGSSVTSYWGEDDILEKGMFEGFYNEQSPLEDQNLTWLGGMTDYGKRYLYNYYGATPMVTRYFEMYNILGDPSADIWTDPPQTLTVTFPGAILIGQPSLTVNVAGYPHWALVNVYSSTENLMFTQYVGAGGSVTFNLGSGFTLPGTLHVWVTGHDCLPYHGTVQIIPPSGPYVIYNSCQINDAQVGNNNGQWDFAETTDLNLGVKNVGIAAANNVNVIISEADPLVTILDSTASYGTVNAGDSLVVAAGFRVQAAGSAPDQHVALFSLTATASNGGPWTSSFNLIINAPAITKDTLVIQDPGGNNNGALDPGETTNFLLTMINEGHSAAQNVAVSMSSNNALVTITGNPGSFGNLAVGANATDSWTVTAGTGITPGTVVRFNLSITAAGGYSTTESFDLVVGDVRNQPTGPDGYGYKAWDNLDGGEAHPYNWIEINPAQGGQGTPIGFTQDDQTVQVNLPFTFRYYGQNFTQISICTNGWIAMGSTTSIDYSNSGIPNSDGPPNMIAPFWDDMSPQLGGRVLHYYNSAQHYFVVEYDSVRQYTPSSAYETFEVILYDPAFHPTSTGDGIILVQYQEVMDISSATVGIENQAQTVGIQYGLNGSWDGYAWPVQSGRTITYTTNVSGPPLAVDVTLTPLNPPIVIPANGGSFNFTAAVVNNGPAQNPFYVWARIKYPDGSYTNPVLGPVQINPPVGVQISRQRTQNVPGAWPAGLYTYLGYGNLSVNYPAVDSASFTFTKSTVADGGPVVGNAYCYGELFPGEAPIAIDTPVAFELQGAYPNPFNPASTINYQLAANSFVSLKVYDTAGRLVSTLVNDWREAGTYKVTFDGSKLASGLYFVRMTAGEFSAVRKMMLVK